MRSLFSASSSTRTRAPSPTSFSSLFFFNHTATTEIYTLSLHDALPISAVNDHDLCFSQPELLLQPHEIVYAVEQPRSEEHTSELQSQSNLVCRLLLEKKKQYIPFAPTYTARALLRLRCRSRGMITRGRE